MSETPGLSIGAVLSGRFQVTEFLGRGDTGEVYTVRDLHGSAIVALKLLFGRPRPDLLSQFQQAARAASSLNVEGIARASDFGIDANTGRAFFVAERVNWQSLDGALRAHGPLNVAQLGVALEVLGKALDAAHAAGIVHRDLKPQNVFISPENPGWVRITDFGISILRNAAPPPPGWGGTPGWVGVDGADPAAPSVRTMDVYALGLVCFFALTRHSPFRSMQAVPLDTARLWEEMKQRVLSWSARAQDFGAVLEPGLDVWFSRALALSPADRFQSVGQMLAAFPGRVAPTLGPATHDSAPPSTAPFVQASVPAMSAPIIHGVSPTIPDQGPFPAGHVPPSPALASSLPGYPAPPSSAPTLPELPPLAHVSPAQPSPASKKRLLAFVIAGFVLLGAGVAVAGWALLNREPGPTDVPLPAPKPATSVTAPPSAQPEAVSAPIASAEAEPTAARVRFRCSPAPCDRIVCDGNELSGVDKGLELPFGEHECTAEKQGFESKAQRFTVSAEESTIEFALTKRVVKRAPSKTSASKAATTKPTKLTKAAATKPATKPAPTSASTVKPVARASAAAKTAAGVVKLGARPVAIGAKAKPATTAKSR